MSTILGNRLGQPELSSANDEEEADVGPIVIWGRRRSLAISHRWWHTIIQITWIELEPFLDFSRGVNCIWTSTTAIILTLFFPTTSQYHEIFGQKMKKYHRLVPFRQHVVSLLSCRCYWEHDSGPCSSLMISCHFWFVTVTLVLWSFLNDFNS